MDENKSVMAINDIVNAMSELSKATDRPVSQTEAHHALKLLKLAIIESLKKGKKVQLTSFVSFVPIYRAPRKGNNVLTNEPLDIPEGVIITAKAGSAIKAASKDIPEEVVLTIKSKALSKKKR